MQRLTPAATSWLEGAVKSVTADKVEVGRTVDCQVLASVGCWHECGQHVPTKEDFRP